MHIIYSLTVERLITEEKGIIPTYGIAAKDTEGQLLAEFNDVSVDRAFATRIVGLLNKCEVELCHFYDVVIDELNR